MRPQEVRIGSFKAPLRPGAVISGAALLAVALASSCPPATQSNMAKDDDVGAPGELAHAVLRTPYGHPDLQGNWTNATLTPLERPPGHGPVLAAEQVEEIEGRQRDLVAEASQPSDADRFPPPVGGDGSPAGGTGTYNYFYMEPGDRVAVYDGEPRSSLIVDPPDGRIPPLTVRAKQARRAVDDAYVRAGFEPTDNPENRPIAERCIIPARPNLGPPMLPNYYYNNNYTIVQTADHVMIMTEMIHDARIIRLAERKPLPDHVRPYWGDSWGRWEGDTLVVETTNLPIRPIHVSVLPYPGGSEQLKVIERFTRADSETINYEFTVEDPLSYVRPWSGQLPFKALDGLLYEYACHEGNYSMFNILSGARTREGQARERR